MSSPMPLRSRAAAAPGRQLDGLDHSPLRTGLLKPSQVARCLGVSRSWVYDAAKDGRLPSVRLGGPAGPLRFIDEDLAAWIEEARSAWRPGDTARQTLRRVGDATVRVGGAADG